MSEAVVLMNALIPLKVLPGWPSATYSPFGEVVLCILGPLAVAVIIALIGLAPGWFRAHRAEEVRAGLADPEPSEAPAVDDAPRRAEISSD